MPRIKAKRLAFAAAAAGMAMLGSTAAQAQDYFIGQMVIVGENFCPRGSMTSAGQLLAISSNTALFSLLGCEFGGDCRTTFALPDMRGRSPIGDGHGPGLPDYIRSERGGSTTRTMTVATLPNHNHAMRASDDGPTQMSPVGNAMPTYPNPAAEIYTTEDPGTSPMNYGVVQLNGGSIPFNISQPTLTLRFCMVTQGLYPSRG